jgi:hypothetical protein
LGKILVRNLKTLEIFARKTEFEAGIPSSRQEDRVQVRKTEF